MVSEVHLDLTGVGDRIAAEMKDTIKDLQQTNDDHITSIGDRLANELKDAMKDLHLARNESLTNVADRMTADIVGAIKDQSIAYDDGLRALGDHIATRLRDGMTNYSNVTKSTKLNADEIGKSVELAIAKHLGDLHKKIADLGEDVNKMQVALSAARATGAEHRDSSSRTDQYLANAVSRATESLERRIEFHCGSQNFKSGMDATSLREQILANGRRLRRLRGAFASNVDYELIVTKVGSAFVAAVVAHEWLHCKWSEMDVIRGDDSDSAITALESLFEASMRDLKEARASFGS